MLYKLFVYVVGLGNVFEFEYPFHPDISVIYPFGCGGLRKGAKRGLMKKIVG